jgi:hypothetical protein
VLALLNLPVLEGGIMGGWPTQARCWLEWGIMPTGSNWPLGGALMLDLAGISGALASAKTILDLLKNANDAQLAIKISAEVANVQGQLIGVQQQTLAIQQENQELRSQLDKFQTFVHHIPLCGDCDQTERTMVLSARHVTPRVAKCG